MYVDNEKISSRQTFRLYVFDLMGIATLLLPPYLAKLCGDDGIFAIIIGSLAGFGYLLYLGWIMKKMGKDICSFLQEDRGLCARIITYTLVCFHSALTAGFCAYIFASLMQYSLIREVAFEIVLLATLLVAAYAVSGGIEGRARVYEVMFWFVLIPYIAMMLASTRDFEVTYFDAFFSANGIDFLKGVYLVFLLVTPLCFSLFLIGEKEKNYGRNMIKTVSMSLLVSSVLLLGSYILLLGNFGSGSLSTMKYPVITLMSTVQFRGNFLKRMDALMLVVWFFTLYALLNLHLHYATKMLKGLRKVKFGFWQIFLPVIVAYTVAYAMWQDAFWMECFLDYYSYVAVPIMVVGPALLLIKRR